jgi:glycosyltransferase involved in cell wall biosynthesis
MNNSPWSKVHGGGPSPDLSLVLPCYNEAGCLELTVPPLARAFEAAGVNLQLVLVDNGSTDRTSAAIDRLMAQGLPITKATVPVNRGQGLGILTGLDLCRGRYVGYLCADGQVAPASVVAVYQALQAAPAPALAKARRRTRPDGWVRMIVSLAYNTLMRLLFPGLRSRDVNANPKMMPAAVLPLLGLSARDWFLEAEVMLKARRLGLPVIEIDVAGRPRVRGRSHVRLATVGEFLRNIAAQRFGLARPGWVRRAKATRVAPLCQWER